MHSYGPDSHCRSVLRDPTQQADRRDDCAGHVKDHAGRGCQANPGWMLVNCPAGCHACHLRDPKARCDRAALGMGTETAVPPGAVDAMFGAIKAGRFDQFAPRFLLEPPPVVQNVLRTLPETLNPRCMSHG